MASPAKAAAANLPRELVLTRVFDAPPQAVFEAWTDASQAALWFGPAGVTAEVLEMDARPGGRYRIAARNPAGQRNIVSGVYREVAAPSRLVFTWAWETPMGDPTSGLNAEMLITVTFKAQGARTEMTLRQVNFASDESRDRHTHGWTGGFEKLAAYLRRDAMSPSGS